MTLHVHVEGQGPDLVLLHGWAMHGGVFAELMPVLAQNFRVHAIDLPGHGRSEFDPAIGDLQQLAALVRPYVPGNSIVIGWSLGGLLTLKLAQHCHLRAMILVSTTPRFVATSGWSQGMAQNVFAMFFSKLQQNLRTTVQDFLALQVRGDSDATHTLLALQRTLLDMPGDGTALQLALQILRDADERTALPTLNVPTLVISGEYDRIAHPKASDYLAQHLQTAQHSMIKRAGHAPFISHRDDFLAEVLRFLGNLSEPIR